MSKLYSPAITIIQCPVQVVESVSNISENVYKNEIYVYIVQQY